MVGVTRGVLFRARLIAIHRGRLHHINRMGEGPRAGEVGPSLLRDQRSPTALFDLLRRLIAIGVFIDAVQPRVALEGHQLWIGFIHRGNRRVARRQDDPRRDILKTLIEHIPGLEGRTGGTRRAGGP